MRKHLVRHRELALTEEQAKAIASSLKPDRDMNERDAANTAGITDGRLTTVQFRIF